MTGDLFEALTQARDVLDTALRAESEKQRKLETDLALAMALDALSRALPYVRHEGPRSQITGAREQVKKVLRGAA